MQSLVSNSYPVSQRLHISPRTPGATVGETGFAEGGTSSKDDYSGMSAEDKHRLAVKRTKGGRYLADINYEELMKYADVPIEEAAKQLGIGLTSLKTRCRECGIPRWPFRNLKKLKKLTDTNPSQEPGSEFARTDASPSASHSGNSHQDQHPNTTSLYPSLLPMSNTATASHPMAELTADEQKKVQEALNILQSRMHRNPADERAAGQQMSLHPTLLTAGTNVATVHGAHMQQPGIAGQFLLSPSPNTGVSTSGVQQQQPVMSQSVLLDTLKLAGSNWNPLLAALTSSTTQAMQQASMMGARSNLLSQQLGAFSVPPITQTADMQQLLALKDLLLGHGKPTGSSMQTDQAGLPTVVPPAGPAPQSVPEPTLTTSASQPTNLTTLHGLGQDHGLGSVAATPTSLYQQEATGMSGTTLPAALLQQLQMRYMGTVATQANALTHNMRQTVNQPSTQQQLVDLLTLYNTSHRTTSGQGPASACAGALQFPATGISPQVQEAELLAQLQAYVQSGDGANAAAGTQAAACSQGLVSGSTSGQAGAVQMVMMQMLGMGMP